MEEMGKRKERKNEEDFYSSQRKNFRREREEAREREREIAEEMK